MHRDHTHDDLVGRVSRDLGNAVEWLTGPAMTDQERREHALADVRNRRFEDTVI